MTAKGFTLLEILLTIAIITILTSLSVPIYQSYQVSNDLTMTSITLGQALRRAEVQARGSVNDSTWGVSVQSGQIVVFQGASYAARDTNYDEITPFATSITPTGLTEAVFSKVTGFPQAAGTITLTSSRGDVKQVVLNAKGMVDYQ